MNALNGNNKEEEQVVESREVPYLSEDIITRIITKVPSVESVFVTFKSVCKSWLNMIRNDIPLLMHPINLEPPGMIIQSIDKYSPKYLSTLSDEERKSWGRHLEPVTYTTRFFKWDKERNEVVEQTTYDLSSCFKYTTIDDSFHGLILASDLSGKDRYIVSPVTKQRLKLPPCFSEHYTKFIYTPSTGEYRVLQLLPRQDDKRFYVRIVRLFSGGIGDLMWKLVKVPKYIRIDKCSNGNLYFADTTALAINGILYLTPRDRDAPSDRKYIASFDANGEKFYKVAHPDYDPSFNLRATRWYMQFDGSLGYIRFDTSSRPDHDQLDIYILKDAAGDPANHRKGREWIKQYSICFAPSIMRSWHWDNKKADHPKCTLRNGEVIIFSSVTYSGTEAQYRAYDIKLNRWWDLEIDLGYGVQNCVRLHAQRSQPILTSPTLTST